jgi:hypothetical protein
MLDVHFDSGDGSNLEDDVEVMSVWTWRRSLTIPVAPSFKSRKLVPRNASELQPRKPRGRSILKMASELETHKQMLDGLFERYLSLLDEYQTAQQELCSCMSAVRALLFYYRPYTLARAQC